MIVCFYFNELVHGHLREAKKSTVRIQKQLALSDIFISSTEILSFDTALNEQIAVCNFSFSLISKLSFLKTLIMLAQNLSFDRTLFALVALVVCHFSCYLKESIQYMNLYKFLILFL